MKPDGTLDAIPFSASFQYELPRQRIVGLAHIYTVRNSGISKDTSIFQTARLQYAVLFEYCFHRWCMHAKYGTVCDKIFLEVEPTCMCSTTDYEPLATTMTVIIGKVPIAASGAFLRSHAIFMNSPHQTRPWWFFVLSSFRRDHRSHAYPVQLSYQSFI